MKKFNLFSLIIILFLVTVTSCERDSGTDPNTAARGHSSARLSASVQARLAELRAELSAKYPGRLEESIAHLMKSNPEYGELVRHALNAVEPTVCNPDTRLYRWLDGEMADWTNDVYFLAAFTGMLSFPTYDALFFENSSAGQYFGLNGEYNQVLTSSFQKLKGFWDIPSNGMVLAAMHGSMLRDRQRLIRIDRIIYGDSQAVAEYYADLILELLRLVPQYRNGDHPIFTFNAYAQSSFTFPPYGVIPAKIVMGDGILLAYSAIGYGDVAPPAILSHEYGHQIQFRLGVFTDEVSPEATRRTELMADAFSAYYLAHPKGAAMQWERARQFLAVFYNIGDCQFTSDGHHGTPWQRMNAAEWAYQQVIKAGKQGSIVPTRTFVVLFDAQLPKIVGQAPVSQ